RWDGVLGQQGRHPRPHHSRHGRSSVEIADVFARFREIKHRIRTRKSPSAWFGEHRSAFTGSGYDVVGIDQWRPGEPLKDIAWGLSLRTYPEKLYRIERAEPRQLRTLLVADLSSSMLFEISREHSKALMLLDVIGSLGLTRMHLQDPVGLLAFSDRVEFYARPKLGSSHVFYIAQQIFDRLRFEEQYPSKRSADFSIVTRFLTERLKSRHSVVLISDFVDAMNDPDAVDYARLRRLAWQHDIVAIVLDDPDEYRIGRRFGYLRIANMETGVQT